VAEALGDLPLALAHFADTAHPDHRSAFAGYKRIVRGYDGFQIPTQAVIATCVLTRTGQKLPPGGIGAYTPRSQTAIRARWMSTGLMASRPLRGLTRRLFFSKAGRSTC
jgi:hypothetical protein